MKHGWGRAFVVVVLLCFFVLWGPMLVCWCHDFNRQLKSVLNYIICILNFFSLFFFWPYLQCLLKLAVATEAETDHNLYAVFCSTL